MFCEFQLSLVSCSCEYFGSFPSYPVPSGPSVVYILYILLSVSSGQEQNVCRRSQLGCDPSQVLKLSVALNLGQHSLHEY